MAPELLFVESGGDNLAAQYSRELVDYTIYVIDVAGGDKVPRKGGPGITQSDLLVVNKTDLAPHVGADLERDGARRGEDARRRPHRVRAVHARRGPRGHRRARARGLARRQNANGVGMKSSTKKASVKTAIGRAPGRSGCAPVGG